MHSDFEEIPDENVIIESPRQLHSIKNNIILTQKKEDQKLPCINNDKNFFSEHKKINIFSDKNYINYSFMGVDTDSLPKKIAKYNQKFSRNKNPNFNIYLFPKINKNIINNCIINLEENNILNKINNNSKKENQELGIMKKPSLENSKFIENMHKNKRLNDVNNFLLNSKLDLESGDLFKNTILIQEGQKYRMINSILNPKSNKTKGRIDNFSSSLYAPKLSKFNKLKIYTRTQSNDNNKKIYNKKEKISRNSYNNTVINGKTQNFLKSFNSLYKNIFIENLLKNRTSNYSFERNKTYKNSLTNSPRKNKKKKKYNNNNFIKTTYDHTNKYSMFLKTINNSIKNSLYKKPSRNFCKKEKIKKEKLNNNNNKNRGIVKENSEILKIQKIVSLTIIDPNKKKLNKPKKKKCHVINYESNKLNKNSNLYANLTKPNTNRNSLTKPVLNDHINYFNSVIMSSSNRMNNYKLKADKNFTDIYFKFNKTKNINFKNNSPTIIKINLNKSCNVNKNNSKNKKGFDFLKTTNSEIYNHFRLNKIKTKKILDKK